MNKKGRICLFTLTFLMTAVLGMLFAGKSAEAKAIKLNKKTVYLAPKMTVKLKVKGTKKKVTWKSSNKKVATVSKKGKVKAKKTGKVTITAKVKGKKLKCKIIVEKKSANNARKLRDYVVKHGTKYKDGDGKTYYAIERVESDDESTEYKARIEAYKDRTAMSFFYTINPDTTAGSSYSYGINIDLVKKKSGRYDLSSRSGSDDSGYYTWGKISTAFDGKGAGVTVSAYYDVDSEGGETKVSNPGSKAVGIGKDYAKAFTALDKLMKAKKIGVTMKSIGFSKWK